MYLLSPYFKRTYLIRTLNLFLFLNYSFLFLIIFPLITFPSLFNNYRI